MKEYISNKATVQISGTVCKNKLKEATEAFLKKAMQYKRKEQQHETAENQKKT